MDFSSATILCLGDVMLDRFAYCASERISPEAPVPVLLLERTATMLGGAGNVARNIAALGGTAVLLGLIGRDPAGAEVQQLVAGAIARARAVGVPVYVDPKSEDFARYHGATCITPNQHELALAARLPVASEAEIVAAAQKVINDSGAAAILATRSEKGMMLVEAGGAVHVEAARAREAYDVT